MGTVYTSRIWGANLAQNSAVDSTAVPIGKRWVARDLVLTGGAAAGRATIWIMSGLEALVLWNGQLQPATSTHLELRQTLYAGEFFRGHSAETTWSVLVTGYELDDTVVGNFPT